MWVWQFDGQWCRIIAQLSREAGSVPSWVSVACPEKEIVSPTLHVSVAGGLSISGTGGVLLTEIVIGWLVVEAPWLSVTRSLTVYVPGDV